MIYDIQFVLPVSSKGIFKKRFEDFLKHYGMYNIKNNKIKIYFLIGTENSDNFEVDINVDYEFISAPDNQASFKIHDFFTKMTIEQANQAKWTAKIDDDTFNDIDTMVKALSDYDHNENIYIVTGPDIREDLEGESIFCLKKLHLWSTIFPNIWHELEGCWISQCTMKKIISNEISLTFLNERKKIKEGFTDQGLAIAAILAKCHIIKDNRFHAAMNQMPLPLTMLSLYGNWICHLHPVSGDKNESIQSIIIKKINSLKGNNDV